MARKSAKRTHNRASDPRKRSSIRPGNPTTRSRLPFCRSSGSSWCISVALGLILISGGILLKAHQAVRLSFYGDASGLKLVNVKGSRPTRILIPSIDVNLPVYETDIVAGVWQIQHDGISHLMQSANPGIRGNIILYGHNSAERLRRLPELVDGQRIIITSEDGSDRMYLVQSTAVVRPNDMSVVAQTPEETLTLYTCYGLADSLRYVVTASPLEDSLAGF